MMAHAHKRNPPQNLDGSGSSGPRVSERVEALGEQTEGHAVKKGADRAQVTADGAAAGGSGAASSRGTPLPGLTGSRFSLALHFTTLASSVSSGLRHQISTSESENR